MTIKVGDVINNYEVLDLFREEKPYGLTSMAKVKCVKCGHVKTLQRGAIRHQGCKQGPCHQKVKDLVGQRFGHLVVLRMIKTECKESPYRWECRCDCGEITITTSGRLSEGQKSCRKCKDKRVAEKKRLPEGEAALNEIFRTYKYGAKRNNREFSLTKKDFIELINKPCYYCGKIPSDDFYKYERNGIDRVDNAIGYTKNNCVPCCSLCNMAKRDLDVNDFLAWISSVYEHSIKMTDSLVSK